MSRRMDYSKQTSWWFCAKLSLMLLWGPAMYNKWMSSASPDFPTGIFCFSGFSWLLTPAGKWLVVGLVVVGAICYMMEFKMRYTTTLLAMLSLLIISYQESTGVFARATVYSTVLLAQALAYGFMRPAGINMLHKYRVNFSVQMIAAGYTLAGFSKWYQSGWEWALGGPYFALQVLKNYTFKYADTANRIWLDTGYDIAQWITQHECATIVMLGAALLLELFCWVVVFDDRLKFVWGLGLAAMHIGIAILMGIGLSSIFFPMVIYFINPLYCLYRGTLATGRLIIRLV